jgi:DNA-binding NarL/FixJ family response regulator
MRVLRLLLATNRAGLSAYFSALPTRGLELVVDQVPLDAGAVRRAGSVEHAAVAVVDVDADDAAALAVIEHLQARRGDLPVIALLCCSHGTTPSALRGLSQAGVTGMLDLHATPEQTWETIAGAAGGNVVVQLRLAAASRSVRQLVEREANGHADVDLDPTETQILQLLSEGRSDQEMANRLYLSPHTIKHRVEALRKKVGARNRIALAAWAGRHGVSHTQHERRAVGAAR